MAEITPEILREKLERRQAGLGAARRPFEPAAREVSRFTSTRTSRFMRSFGQNNQTFADSVSNNRLYNPAAVVAFRTLKNGMASGMSSPSQPWFVLAAADADLKDVQSVKVWLDDAKSIVQQLMASTTLYTSMQTGYDEIGRYGTEAGYIAPHWQYGAATGAFTFGEYWLGQDDAGRVDTLSRDSTMTVANLFDKFDESKISQAAKRLKTQGRLDALVPVMQMVEPNRERSYGKIDRTNMPWRSVYWEPGQDKVKDVLAFEGFTEKPFWGARWDVSSGETYGLGPGYDALPSARKIQLGEVRLQGAIDYTVKPPLVAEPGMRNTLANIIPGGITYSAAQDMANAIRPVWQIDPRSIELIGGDNDRTERWIQEASYAELFMAITNMRGIQPRNMEEIAKRNEEKLSQLGPVVDRVQVEKLSVIVMAFFKIALNANLLPPVPEELNGRAVNIEFVSILAFAMKMLGLGTMERFFGFVGNIAAIHPEILDKVDFDQAVDEYAERSGVPSRVVVSDDDVSAVRQARAQQQQQERAAAMMPAVQQGADAARLLSETDTGGGRNALQALMPGV